MIGALDKPTEGKVFTMSSFNPIYRLYSDIYHYVCSKSHHLFVLEEALMRLYIVRKSTNPLFINGRKMNVHLKDPGISTELTLFRVHEPVSTQILIKSLKSGSFCLEVGANMGYYTLLMSGLIGKEGKLLTVEPHPENFNMLLTNVSMNNLRNVECFNLACSNYEGYGKMKVMPQSNWHRLDVDNKGDLQVEVTKVDILTKEVERLDFMRMDVEGHEAKVIEGSHKTIENLRPSLFLEFHPTLLGKDSTLKLLKRLKDYGYEIDYFIPRFLDVPLIGKISHARKITIEQYMNRIEKADKIEGREANVFLST